MSADVPAIDLRTLLGEMAALRAEVRKQTEVTRQVTAASTTPSAPDDGPALRLVIDLIDRIEAARASLLTPAPRRWFRRPDPQVGALAEGLALTLARALSDLRAMGVERVETRGGFDATCMEALEAVPGGAPGQIARTLLPGYRRGDTLIRTAQVAVYYAAKEAP